MAEEENPLNHPILLPEERLSHDSLPDLACESTVHATISAKSNWLLILANYILPRKCQRAEHTLVLVVLIFAVASNALGGAPAFAVAFAFLNLHRLLFLRGLRDSVSPWWVFCSSLLRSQIFFHRYIKIKQLFAALLEPADVKMCACLRHVNARDIKKQKAAANGMRINGMRHKLRLVQLVQGNLCVLG